tara:strand:- start:452 stop:700 length:249 start_codon:yes stop_codon:yes gene_type:complete
MFSLISGIMNKYKTEDKTTIRAFGGNRIIQDNNIRQESSDPSVVKKNSSEKPKRIYAFGYNRVVNNTPNQIKTSIFGYPFVK